MQFRSQKLSHTVWVDEVVEAVEHVLVEFVD